MKDVSIYKYTSTNSFYFQLVTSLFYSKIGTMATKYKKEYKVTKDGDAGKSSVRGPSQVLACSAIAVACSLYHAICYGEEKALGKCSASQVAMASGIKLRLLLYQLYDTLL